MDTTAIIQFIGIVLFSATVPNDPGVHAILPTIGHVEHLTVGTALKDPKKPTAEAGVEKHVAVIIYREDDRLTGSWRRDGQLQNGWEFVRLDGEQLQFLANASNDSPEIPREIPRAFLSAPGSCLKPPSLKATYSAPNYKAAAAVVDVPFGTLRVCASNTRTEAERIDTTLLLKNEGVVVVTAKHWNEPQPKTISLKGGAIVYVANVPPYYLFFGPATPVGSYPHWEAYNAMLETGCGGRPVGPWVPEECDLTPINSSFRVAKAYPPGDFRLINSECSNSQWP